jgi:integrase
VFLDADQLKALLAAAPTREARRLFQAGIYTGCRLGELMAANCADFDGAVLHVDGKTGRRPVYVSAKARRWFRRLTRNRAPEEPLLLRPDGTRWHKVAAGRAMRQAVTDAELPPETVFYSLRHSYISLAMARGVQIQVLAENCGTSVAMIQKHYGKFADDHRQAQFEVMV